MREGHDFQSCRNDFEMRIGPTEIGPSPVSKQGGQNGAREVLHDVVRPRDRARCKDPFVGPDTVVGAISEPCKIFLCACQASLGLGRTGVAPTRSLADPLIDPVVYCFVPELTVLRLEHPVAFVGEVEHL